MSQKTSEFINLNEFYNNENIDQQLSQVNNSFVTEYNKLITQMNKKRVKDGKTPVQLFEKIDIKQLKTNLTNVLLEINTELSKKLTNQADREKYLQYNFNEFYFFDKQHNVFGKPADLRKFINDIQYQFHKQKIQFLNCIYIIAQQQNYKYIKEMINISQIRTIQADAMEIFNVKEIKEFIPVVTNIFTSLGQQDLSKLFDIFEPFYKLSKSKQNQILEIISKTIQQVIVFMFILINKNIIPFVLKKINNEIQKQGISNDQQLQQVQDNVYEFFQQYQQNFLKNNENTENKTKITVQNSSKEQFSLQIDLKKYDELETLCSQIIIFVCKKEQYDQKFTDLQSISADMFDTNQIIKLQYYISLFFLPFQNYLMVLYQQNDNTQIMEKIQNFINDFIMNINIQEIMNKLKEYVQQVKSGNKNLLSVLQEQYIKQQQ